MTPTPKLRFVERLVPLPEHGGYLKTVRILQQWWHADVVPERSDWEVSEWRDVPIEKE